MKILVMKPCPGRGNRQRTDSIVDTGSLKCERSTKRASAMELQEQIDSQ